MMKVYLVDDEDSKAESISRCVCDEFPDVQLERYRSFQSGLKALVLTPPELLLLDMTMPTYDVGPREPGGRERRYAGREVIRQLQRRGVTVPVVVITQYEQFEEGGRQVDLSTLKAELASDFPENFVDAVYYNAADSRWMKVLTGLMSPYMLSKE